MTSQKLFDHLWMPFTSHQDFLDDPPVVIERGKGIYIYDQQGNPYIDGIGSWWVSLFGHNHPTITAAVHHQLDKIEHVLMAGCVAPPTIEMATILGKILPSQLTKTFYSDDGSTSVEVAMKIALQFHYIRNDRKRTRFVALGGGYHGDTLGAVSVGAIPQYHPPFHETFKSQFYTDPPYCYRCPAGKQKETCSAECMDSLKAILEAHGEQIAACIFEPMVQGVSGMRVYPPKVLKKIFALCEEYDILTIADEVAMGLGRTGKMFACDHAEVVPDMMCLAKGLTGGYLPLAVTAVKEKLYEEFCGDYLSNRTFEHGHTFTGNPLAAAAGCAALTMLVESDMPNSLAPLIDCFKTELLKFNDLECVGDIRNIGMVGALDIVKNRETREKFLPQQRFCYNVCKKAREKGLMIRPLGDCIYFMPAFIIETEQIKQMLAIARSAIEETLAL